MYNLDTFYMNYDIMYIVTHIVMRDEARIKN